MTAVWSQRLDAICTDGPVWPLWFAEPGADELGPVGRLHAVVAGVAALHHLPRGGAECGECDQPWPCTTTRLVRGSHGRLGGDVVA